MWTFRPQHQKVDYTFDDFKYVARLADFKFAILARKEAAYSTWQEFLTFAKAKGEVTFGLITPVQKLVADEIGKAEGFKFRAVPYKGGAKLLAALLGGHIDIGISGGRFFPHYDAGEVKVIAAAGSERIPGIDAPTLRASSATTNRSTCSTCWSRQPACPTMWLIRSPPLLPSRSKTRTTLT